MTIAETMEKMVVFSKGNLHDINHFLKVYAYAKTIGELEKLDSKTQKILELAAIVHDIACPLCREKYGNTNGTKQELEGGPLAKDFLSNLIWDEEIVERVSYLVAHHHTYTQVDGIDYQILLEADFLVNADESHLPLETIQHVKEKVFRTEAGIRLLQEMYQNA